MAARLFDCRLHNTLRAENRADDQVVNAGPKQVHVDAHLLQMLAESSQRPFVAEVVLLTVFIRNKLVVLLVDCIVGKVHEFVLLVDFLSVSLRGKAGKAFLMNIDAQGLVASYAHIDTQVELVAVDQQRVRNVLADHGGLIHVDVVDVVNNVDALALAVVRGLDDPHVLLAFVLLQLLVVVVEVAEFFGQDVSVGSHVESRLPKLLLHAHDVVTQTILASDFVA